MKKFIITVLVLLGTVHSHAQLFGDQVINNPNFDQQRFSYGYFVGFNSYNLKFNYKNKLEDGTSFLGQKDVRVARSTGFNVGLVGNMRLTEHLDLRLEPGVSFNQMDLILIPGESDSFREVNSTYVHVPLLLKFSTTRINNFKPFVVGGLSTSLNLSSNENAPFEEKDNTFRMTTQTFYYEIGFGIDLYLYYFKFTPSIRGVFAINDEFVGNPNDRFLDKIDSMSSRGLFINFTFQ